MPYRADPIVRATWDYELADLERAELCVRRKGALLRVLALVWATVAVASAMLIVTLPPDVILDSLTAMPALGTLLSAWVVRSARNAERHHEALQMRGSQHLEVTDERFALRDEVSAASLAWDLLVGWDETDHDFYVFRDVGRYHLIPKRAFERPADIAALRRLLAELVPTRGAPQAPSMDASWTPTIAWLAIVVLAFASIVEAIAR